MRHTVTAEREAEYLDAVLCPGRDVALSPELAQEVEWVRELFVLRLGWDRLRLARYPFRALSAVARPGDWVMARLRGPADYAAELDAPLLHLTLAEVAALPHAKRRAYVDEALLPETSEVAEHAARLKARFRFSDADRAWVRKLAAAHALAVTDRDAREGDAELGQAVMRLLRLAYDRGN